MDEGKTPFQDVSAMMSQGVEQARRAMETYLQDFQKNMSASPWASSELNRKLTGYAQKNVATAFEFAQKLSLAKDIQDAVRIQTDFFQTQLKSLTEQAKDFSETATKTVESSFKGAPKTTSGQL